MYHFRIKSNICIWICANIWKRIWANEANKWCLRIYQNMGIWSEYDPYSLRFAWKRIKKSCEYGTPYYVLVISNIVMLYLVTKALQDPPWSSSIVPKTKSKRRRSGLWTICLDPLRILQRRLAWRPVSTRKLPEYQWKWRYSGPSCCRRTLEPPGVKMTDILRSSLNDYRKPETQEQWPPGC
jgi:hypothetical protein